MKEEYTITLKREEWFGVTGSIDIVSRTAKSEEERIEIKTLAEKISHQMLQQEKEYMRDFSLEKSEQGDKNG